MTKAVETRETDGPIQERGGALYRTLWRWHFYAGLICIPFVIWLAVTGSVYLFRPQIEAWFDSDVAVLERLPECLERTSLELGQLIEEQDPVVRQ